MESYGRIWEGVRGAVLDITDDRAAYGCQLCTDLVMSSGMEVDLQQRLPFGGLSHHSILQHRLLRLLRRRADRVALILIPIAKEMVGQSGSGAIRTSLDKGEVDLLKVVPTAKGVIESCECLAGACEEYHPAHRSVKSVCHPEEDSTGLIVLILDIGFAGLHKWLISGTIPLHDLTGSLGDSEQVVVLVEYLHRIRVPYHHRPAAPVR